MHSDTDVHLSCLRRRSHSRAQTLHMCKMAQAPEGQSTATQSMSCVALGICLNEPATENCSPDSSLLAGNNYHHWVTTVTIVVGSSSDNPSITLREMTTSCLQDTTSTLLPLLLKQGWFLKNYLIHPPPGIVLSAITVTHTGGPTHTCAWSEVMCWGLAGEAGWPSSCLTSTFVKILWLSALLRRSSSRDIGVQHV